MKPTNGGPMHATTARTTKRSISRLLLPVLLALTLLAAACGSDDDTDTAAPEPPATTASEAGDEGASAEPDADETTSSGEDAQSAEAPDQIGGELNLYNWTDYISEDLLSRFTDETGIAVNLSNYDSNETMLATLAAGGTGYDVIVPSDYIIPQLIEQDLIQRIDAFALENASNIDPAFLNPYFDDGRVYTAPYLYGTTGLAVDTSQVPDPPDTWAEFFAVPEGSDGSIGMMNDQIEVIHAVLRAVGAEPCSTNPADYALADELLEEFKPAVSVINSDGIIERMAAGENSMHMEWNGAAYRSSLENPDLVYVYLSDGLTLWQDNFAVPRGAPNFEQALVFINWMMDPRNIAEATNWNAYGNAITGSDAYVDPELASSPMVVPATEQLAHAAPVESCSVEAIDLYDRLWTSFRS
ncbi:extracellular solute-binding protein [Candidatus Poriferisodalis sp.]|uniref:extracellular solute-binding protein n=1 Tax=Candidatus Poriferisodalis sp. TaxID=3101277 RepID=UPI003B593454